MNFGRLRPLKPTILLSKTSIFKKNAIFSDWRRFDHIFCYSGMAWAAPEHDFRSPWALCVLLGRCWSSPGGHSDTPGTLFNSIWVLWHPQKVAGSMQKAILAYFGTLPHSPRSLPDGTSHQNPRFLVSHCAYLARARWYVSIELLFPTICRQSIVKTDVY